MARREKQPRGVVDTSVVIAGVAGFKPGRTTENPSASFLRDWLERGTFVWLVTEDVLSEYKGVLTRLGVRRHLVGNIINLLREEAEFVDVREESDVSPDPNDNAICACAEQGGAAFYRHSEQEGLPPEETGSESDIAWRCLSYYTTRSTSLST